MEAVHVVNYANDTEMLVIVCGYVSIIRDDLHHNPGADPAAGKGGAQIVDHWRGFQGAGPLAGVQGAEPPGGGCKGAEPPCVGKFWISELNSRDLVHTFCQHHIENLLIYFQ